MNKINKTRNTKKLHIGSLGKTDDIKQAINVIKNGGIVVTQIYGVFAIVANGKNSQALKKIITVKQDSNILRPFSSISHISKLSHLIDKKEIHTVFQNLFNDLLTLQSVIGTMMHLRLPLLTENVEKVPLQMRSLQQGKWMMHNFDPSNHPVSKLVEALNSINIDFIAITTLNKHAVESEITELQKAIEFCYPLLGTDLKIPVILTDPHYKLSEVKGSFPIVDTTSGKIVREGIIPIQIIKKLLQTELNIEGMKSAKYTQSRKLLDLDKYNYEPKFMRLLIHNFIRGHKLKSIEKRIQKMIIKK